MGASLCDVIYICIHVEHTYIYRYTHIYIYIFLSIYIYIYNMQGCSGLGLQNRNFCYDSLVFLEPGPEIGGRVTGLHPCPDPWADLKNRCSKGSRIYTIRALEARIGGSTFWILPGRNPAVLILGPSGNQAWVGTRRWHEPTTR